VEQVLGEQVLGEQVLGERAGVLRCAVMGHGSGTEPASLVAYYVAAAEAEVTHNEHRAGS
jgi:hypothetical protein